MSDYIVFEIRAWFLLVLVLAVLAAAAVGAWLLWRWIGKRREQAEAWAREQAETEATARRNRMLVRLDHELKNPLTALRTSVATVRAAADDEHPDPGVIGPAVRQIDSSARRVARLLADLRKLADVETRAIAFQRIDMDRLIHQAVEDARTAPGAEDRMIVATVARAPWKLPEVAGEEDLLLSAILNLLGNAIKYSADTDTVELRANEQIIDHHRWVVVEVADTGSGIPVDEQSRVWDELQRGSKVRAVAGSGMGLSLVRAIIARHGGTVELFSQEGVGTSVRMVLPVMGDAPRNEQGGAQVPGADMAQVAAGSRAVQPFQGQKGQGGAPRFLPPREPSQDERRFMGTPRRGSRRRIQNIDGELVDTSTGESFGGGAGAGSSGAAGAAVAGGPAGAGGAAGDSGPYRRFKPPATASPGTQAPGGQGGQSRGGQAQEPQVGQPAHAGPGPHGAGAAGSAQAGSGPQAAQGGHAGTGPQAGQSAHPGAASGSQPVPPQGFVPQARQDSAHQVSPQGSARQGHGQGHGHGSASQWPSPQPGFHQPAEGSVPAYGSQRPAPQPSPQQPGQQGGQTPGQPGPGQPEPGQSAPGQWGPGQSGELRRPRPEEPR
ncbi:sensor histidine kinase [Brevibacterium album]|uniref:sensor histidine kinase n=1 Tax=Brevibacterium album TaxID=417948 RepID=UPI0003F8B2CE|nr:HAMP domain-containing sensor histidine kinase [Brevibacterium album]